MGMTATQKIFARHAGRKSVAAGELITADVDLVLGNDITSPVAIAEMKKAGERVLDPDKVVLVLDHFVPQRTSNPPNSARSSAILRANKA